jgi:hypothetical protein
MNLLLAYAYYHANPILLIILVVLLIALLPSWPYSTGWGYYPSGSIGLILVILFVLLLFGCTSVPIQGTSPVTTTEQDLNTLAAEVTKDYVDYKAGNVNWAWYAANVLYISEAAIKTKDDFESLLATWKVPGTFAEKLARVFAASTAPPAAKTATIAGAIQAVAATSRKP